MISNSKIYLVPTVLSEDTEFVIPAYVVDIVSNLDCFVVEDLRTARRYLRKINYKKDFDKEVHFTEIAKNAKTDFKPISDKMLQGKSVGVLSEAGCAGIADPGSDFISLAHKLGVEVHPLVGPSSILLALIASGMSGQHFTFHGYLPIEKGDKIKKLNELQNNAHKTGYTQIFMETPYRNNALILDILENCDSNLNLCIATDITGKAESIRTKKLKEWKSSKPDIHKVPTVFCLNY